MHPERNRIFENSVYTAFERSVRQHSDALALVYQERRWRYRQLNQAVERVAGGLYHLGLRKGDRVIACGKNSDAYMLLWLACARMGLVHVPVNYALTGPELQYIGRHSGAKALFCDSAMGANVEAMDAQRPGILGTFYGGEENDVLGWATGSDAMEAPRVPIADTDPAQIIYTSGTTAAPKGVVHTHRSLLLQYYSCLIALDINGDDRILAALPLYHCAQMHVFTMPSLLIGAANHLLQGPDIPRCIDLIRSQRLNAFFAPPTVWTNLLRHEPLDPNAIATLEKAYYGASTMPEQVLKGLTKLLPRVGFYNCYGQTELAPLATVLSPEQHRLRPTSVGKPVINVETRLVDETMRDVPVGEVGEIVHRSPQLLPAYWQNPEATAEAFEGDWFHSGDMAYADKEGFLYITDRKKDIINTGGVVVSSREVEEALYTHPAVSQVAVIGLEDRTWIEAICAVVVLKQGVQVGDDELTGHLRERLARHKLPKRYIYLDSLPVNTAGKVLKRELRERYA